MFGNCSSFRVRSSGRVVEMLASAVLELLGLNWVRKVLGIGVVVDGW